MRGLEAKCSYVGLGVGLQVPSTEGRAGPQAGRGDLEDRTMATEEQERISPVRLLCRKRGVSEVGGAKGKG